MNDKKAKAEKMKVVSTVFEKCSVRVILDKNGNPWWVARDLAEPLDYKNIEVLLAIRRIGKYSVMGESNKFLENMLRTVQVQHSKDVAGKFYEAVGREGLQHYFGRSHRAATGCSLRERQAWARGEKLPSRKRTSGGEISRHLMLETVCAMSFEDDLVLGNVREEDALEMVPAARDLYKRAIGAGYRPPELDMPYPLS